MKSNIVIIGSGITGKIAKYIFNRESILLGTSPSLNYGLFYIHKFLDDNLTYDKLKIRTVIDFNGDDIHKQYCLRTRGKELDFDLSIDRIQEETIGWRLNKKVLSYSDIDANAAEIDIENKCIKFEGDVPGNSGVIEYKYIINTIPIPELIKLTHLSSDVIILPVAGTGMTFDAVPIGLKYKKNLAKDSSCDIKVLYLPSDDPLAYRASGNEDFSVYEYSFAYADNLECKDYDKVLRPGKLIHNDDTKIILGLFEKFGIFSIGRYAEWSQLILVHHSYDRLIKLKEKIGG